MKKLKSLLELVLLMMKIGCFTFGGGYAMIHLLESEFVGKRAWIDSDDFMNLVVVAESTPGPIASNCSTFIGYKREGVPGAIAATLGMCIPSFTIIFLISLFFDQFLAIEWVAKAFRGIQICVVFLIMSAGFKMLKKMKKTPFSLTVLSVTLLSSVLLGLFGVKFSSIFYILIFGTVGLLTYSIGYARSKREGDK